MKESLGKAYHQFHLRHSKYGFAHHLTSKGGFYQREVGVGKNVLDLGCRDGTMTSIFAEGNQLVCVDVDSAGLRLCAENLQVDTVWHDINELLPFDDASFDMVIASDVLEHVVLHQQLVDECSRVLNGGGVFLGSTPNAYYWSNRIKMLLGIDIIEYIDPMHIRHFSMSSLSSLLSGVFTEAEVIPYGHHTLVNIAPRLFASDFLWKARKKGYKP